MKSSVQSSRKVLVHKDQVTSPCPCPWTKKSSKIIKDFAFCKLSVMYDHVKTINSVTTAMHEDTVKNVLLTDVRYFTYIDIIVSKPFFTVTQCCCPREPIYKSLTLSTDFKSLSLSSSLKSMKTSPMLPLSLNTKWSLFRDQGKLPARLVAAVGYDVGRHLSIPGQSFVRRRVHQLTVPLSVSVCLCLFVRLSVCRIAYQRSLTPDTN